MLLRSKTAREQERSAGSKHRMLVWLLVVSIVAVRAEDCGGYALELLPSPEASPGRGEYQLDIVNLTSGPGIYRLSAWVMYSLDLEIPDGNRTVFHARWWNQEGEIKDGTNKVFEEKFWPTEPDVYQFLSLDFDTGDEEPSWIEWYVGYPLLLEEGSIRMTGLQAEGPDGRRYIVNGDFIGGQDIEYYQATKSYGVTDIVKDDTLPCIENRWYSYGGLIDTKDMSSEVQKIDFIQRREGYVDALFDLRGSFQPHTFGSLNYYWFETEDAGPWSPNRVHFLSNVRIYFDANGFITTPSPKNIIVTDAMLPHRPFACQVSGVDFFNKFYSPHWPHSQFCSFCHFDDLTHLCLPGLRYDYDDDRIDVFLPALLFNYDNDTSPLLLDLTFGPDQSSSYYRWDPI